jgi:Super-infection exclusion protein B
MPDNDARSAHEGEGSVLASIGALITAIREAGPPIYGAVLIATLLLSFLPESILDRLGLHDVVNTYRMYIGIALIASVSLLLVHLILVAWSPIAERFETRQLNRVGSRKLKELTREEKDFLKFYIIQGKTSVIAPITSGIAQGLVANGIIFRSSQLSSGMNFPYNLQPYIRRILTEHPSLLD